MASRRSPTNGDTTDEDAARHQASSSSTAASTSVSTQSTGSSGRLSSIKAMFTPAAPATLLADMAPQLLHPSIVRSPHFSSRQSAAAIGTRSSSIRSRLGLGWGAASTLQDSNSIYIREKVEDLLRLDVPAAPFDFSASALGRHPAQIQQQQLQLQQQIEYIAPDSQVPLIRGFQATAPAAQAAKLERRRRRAGLGEQVLGLEDGKKLGLRQRGDKARGMLTSSPEEQESGQASLGINSRTSAASTRQRRRRSARRSELFTPARTMPAADGQRSGGLASLDENDQEDDDVPEQTLEEMESDVRAVEVDMSNVTVRRALLNSQVSGVDAKIAALDAIRESLKRDLLSLREEELELEDELEGLRERIVLKSEKVQGRQVSLSSRRRKGPAFLPTEHDDLPSGVAFMTLSGHLAPITAVDFSEPYGTLVTASYDQSVRLWDLTNGDEIGYLKGHKGTVKVLQVESSLCVTGGADGQIRIWDLDAAEAAFPPALKTPTGEFDRVTRSMESMLLGRETDPMEDVFTAQPSVVGSGAGLVNGNGLLEQEGMMREQPDSSRSNSNDGPCIKTLDGHSKSVTSLYFDGSCLVTGSNDSTLRQWDLTTGQCVLTMDILWAISNASQNLTSSEEDMGGYPTTPHVSPRKSFGALRRQSSSFGSPGPGVGAGGGSGYAGSPTTTTYADGSWELYDDFVGGVQFWGYALASGTADGCVRMWDMRTGQAHRTLVGHTGPVTCLQFDEMHLVSGSLDKSIRIWDLRTGSISDTIRYDHPITGLQFDTRKIVSAAGENGVRVFNRTTLQHTSLTVNGHTSPVERLRFMDSYLCSGGRDNTVKIWRL
ncbi:hypothetical protein ACM66B_004417 [Microbotryomycetes sp. NB124-2]